MLPPLPAGRRSQEKAISAPAGHQDDVLAPGLHVLGRGAQNHRVSAAPDCLVHGHAALGEEGFGDVGDHQPEVRVQVARSLRTSSFGWYPMQEITAPTRSTVAGLTAGSLLTIRETVLMETPVYLATS